MNAENIALLSVLIAGSVSLLFYLRLKFMISKIRCWNETTAFVKKSLFITKRNNPILLFFAILGGIPIARKRWIPQIEYIYNYKGQQYTSNTIDYVFDFFKIGYSKEIDVNQYLEAYQPDNEIKILVDPYNPNNSCIEESSGAEFIFLIFGLLFLLSSFLIIW